MKLWTKYVFCVVLIKQ